MAPQQRKFHTQDLNHPNVGTATGNVVHAPARNRRGAFTGLPLCDQQSKDRRYVAGAVNCSRCLLRMENSP